MITQPHIGPRHDALVTAIDEAARMAGYPVLFAPEEVLDQLLKAARLAFDIAGQREGQTSRQALHRAIVEYVDGTAPAVPAPPIHLLKGLDQ